MRNWLKCKTRCKEDSSSDPWEGIRKYSLIQSTGFSSWETGLFQRHFFSLSLKENEIVKKDCFSQGQNVVFHHMRRKCIDKPADHNLNSHFH
jgi:hypothetical protein